MKAKLEIIGAMAAFGTIGAFVRHIPLPSGELALYRALIAAGAIFLWQLCTGRGLGIKDVKAELHLLICQGRPLESTGYCFLRHTAIPRLQWLLSATILPLSS